MLRMNRLVFADNVSQPGSASYFTTVEFNELLGRFDQLAVQLVIDNVTFTGSPTVSVGLQTSCDGEHFSTKTTMIASTPIAAGTTVLWGGDAGTNPSATFVRFSIVIVASAALTAHVRLLVTARDQGGVQIVRHDRAYDVVERPIELTNAQKFQRARDQFCHNKTDVLGCKSCMDRCYQRNQYKPLLPTIAGCEDSCLCLASHTSC